MKTASIAFLAAAIAGGVSCQRVLDDAVPVVGVDFIRPSQDSGDDAESMTTAVGGDEELIKAVEYDDKISVVSQIQVGELQCDTLAQAEDADTLSFVLLGDESITAEKTLYAATNGDAFTNGIGRKVWTGTVTDPAQGEDEAVPRTVSMTWGDECNTETFLLKVSKQSVDGVTSVMKTFPCYGSTTRTCMVEVEVELDEPDTGLSPYGDNSLGTPADSKEERPPDASYTAVPASSERRLQDAGDTVIDVMVLYSNESLVAAGDISDQMETILWESVARTNEAFVNSDVALSMNVVWIGLLPYPQPSTSTSSSVQALLFDDYVESLRDATGADLVQMIGSFDNDACASGYLYGADARYGFSVVDVTCLDGRSDSHEYGHNLGCDHNKEDASRLTDYAHGFRYCSGDDQYRTIMSYRCDAAPRVNYFSNPDVEYLDKPTGTETADCARAIEDNMVVVSNYRQRATVPLTPSPVTATLAPTNTATPSPTTGRRSPPVTATPSPIIATTSPINNTPVPTINATPIPTITATPVPANAATPVPTLAATRAPSIEHRTTYTLLGCYGDTTSDRVLSGEFVKGDPTMTTEVCAAICEDYPFFGTEYGSECFCGVDGDDPTRLGDASCTYVCAGDASQTCGGSSAIMVYKNTDWEATPLDYLGCWKDTKRGRIMTVMDVDLSMTNDLCAEMCSSYPLYGTQYGVECWCGGETDDYKTHGESDSCTVGCAGDPSQMCGGSYAMDVYEHDTVVAPQGYLGCWTDTSGGRVMSVMVESSLSMTNEACEQICSSYAFYGTQYGQECWCGDESTVYTTHGESDACSMACTGDTATVCGGRYAISVWESK